MIEKQGENEYGVKRLFMVEYRQHEK